MCLTTFVTKLYYAITNLTRRIESSHERHPRLHR